MCISDEICLHVHVWLTESKDNSDVLTVHTMQLGKMENNKEFRPHVTHY